MKNLYELKKKIIRMTADDVMEIKKNIRGKGNTKSTCYIKGGLGVLKKLTFSCIKKEALNRWNLATIHHGKRVGT